MDHHRPVLYMYLENSILEDWYVLLHKLTSLLKFPLLKVPICDIKSVPNIFKFYDNWVLKYFCLRSDNGEDLYESYYDGTIESEDAV